MMMSKLLRCIFKEYEEDDVSPYIHSGVGYAGIEYDLYHNEPGRKKHCGIGYTGVYDE